MPSVERPRDTIDENFSQDVRQPLDPDAAWVNKRGELVDGTTPYDVEVVYLGDSVTVAPRTDYPRVERKILEEADRALVKDGHVPLFAPHEFGHRKHPILGGVARKLGQLTVLLRHSN